MFGLRDVIHDTYYRFFEYPWNKFNTICQLVITLLKEEPLPYSGLNWRGSSFETRHLETSAVLNTFSFFDTKPNLWRIECSN